MMLHSGPLYTHYMHTQQLIICDRLWEKGKRAHFMEVTKFLLFGERAKRARHYQVQRMENR